MNIQSVFNAQKASIQFASGYQQPVFKANRNADSFHASSKAGSTDSVQFGGLFPSKNQKLINAAQKGQLKKVETLIKSGADVNFQDKHGKSPLMAAALSNSVLVIDELLKNGANVNARGNDKSTALTYLVQSDNSNTDILRASIAEKLATPKTINVRDDNGNSAFNLAIKNGLTKTAAVLIEKGADVQYADNQGMTPLMYATWNGDAEAALQILLAVPAEDRRGYVNQKNKWNHTALEIIKGRKDRDNVRKVFVNLGVL